MTQPDQEPKVNPMLDPKVLEDALARLGLGKYDLSKIITTTPPEKPKFQLQIPNTTYAESIIRFTELATEKGFTSEEPLQKLINKYAGEEKFFSLMIEILEKRTEKFSSSCDFNGLISYRIQNSTDVIIILEGIKDVFPEKIFDGTCSVLSQASINNFTLGCTHQAKRIPEIVKYVSGFYAHAPNSFFSAYSYALYQVILDYSKEPAFDLKYTSSSTLKPKNFIPEKLKAYYEAGHHYIPHLDVFAPYNFDFENERMIPSRQLELLDRIAKAENYPGIELREKIAKEFLMVPETLQSELLPLVEIFSISKTDFKYFYLLIETVENPNLDLDISKKIIESLVDYGNKELAIGILIFNEVTKTDPEKLNNYLPYFQSGQLAELEREIYREKLIQHQSQFPQKPIEEIKTAFQNKESADTELAPEIALSKAFKKYALIEKQSETLAQLPTTEIIFKIEELKKEYLATRDDLDLFDVEFLALTRELFKRHYGVYPYNTQIITVLLINDQTTWGSPIADADYNCRGVYSQIKTGEGKSLIFALQAAYQATLGHNVDIITSNPYLAERDALKFSAFFQDLGISCDAFDFKTETKKKDNIPKVLYTTNQSLIFEYLSSRLNHRSFLDNQRFDVALVDEADNMCLDLTNESCRIATPAAPLFTKEEFQTIIDFVDQYGHALIRQNIPEAITAFHIRHPEPAFTQKSNILTALYLLSAIRSSEVIVNQDYIIQNDQVLIVDVGNTGRIKERTIWGEGPHEFVALRNNLPLPASSAVSAQMSHPAFLRKYQTIQCISGTFGDLADRTEIQELYGLNGFDVPTHHATIREDYPVTLLKTETEWLATITTWAKEYTVEQTRPLLIIATSIADSEKIHAELIAAGLTAQLLNDKDNQDAQGNSVKEDQIIKSAGIARMITVATDVAGRGADITPSSEAIEAGGLHVIATAIPSNKRVEYQARGRAGRQGRPGSSEVLACLETDTFLNSIPEQLKTAISQIADQEGADSPQLQQTIEFIRRATNIINSIVRVARLNKEKIAETALNNYLAKASNVSSELTSNNPIFRDNQHQNLGGFIVSMFMQERWTQAYHAFDLTLNNQHILWGTSNQNPTINPLTVKALKNLESAFKNSFFISSESLATGAPNNFNHFLGSLNFYFIQQVILTSSRAQTLDLKSVERMLADLNFQVEALTEECYQTFANAGVHQINQFIKTLTEDKEEVSKEQ